MGFSIQTEKRIEHNKPDIVVLDKNKRVCPVIDVACPFDTSIQKKGQEKIEYYNDLKYEILKCWNKEVDKVMILPIVIGALGTVTNNLRKNLDKVDLHLGIDALQKNMSSWDSANHPESPRYKLKNKGVLHRRTEKRRRRTEMLPILDHG